MADVALVVSSVLHFFQRGEVDMINVHGVGVPSRRLGSLRSGNGTVLPTSEVSESDHILVEFSWLIQPLFPFSGLLVIWGYGGGHHDSKLIRNSLLKGVNKDTIIVHSTLSLCQPEGSGILVKSPLNWSMESE